MKKLITCLALLAMASITYAQTLTNYFPNGQFENSPGVPADTNGVGWSEFATGAGNVTFAYPTSGGNLGAYGIIDHVDTNGGWGIWVSDVNNQSPLNAYGMVPGGFYEFTMDMQEISVIEDGLSPPGLKVEFYGPNGYASDTGDMLGADLTSSWATYKYFVAVPSEATLFKVVPFNTDTTARVGFDNIGVIVPPQSLVASIVSPANGETISGPAISIIASAAISPGSVTNVSFYDDNGATLLGSDDTAPYTLDANVGIGTHVLTVVATDSNGNSVTSLAVTVTTEAATPVLVENGDFESSPPGTNWAFNSGGGTFNFSFPTNGGNPDGYAVIDNPDGNGWGLLITGPTPSDGDPIPIDPLGLVAGNTYTFFQDMNTFTNGTANGGVKYEYFDSGNSFLSNDGGDKFASSSSGIWETYTFSSTLAAGTYGLKIIPLWGAGASVGFDNIGVFVPPQPLTNWITSPAEGSTNAISGFEITARAVVSPAAVTNVNFYENSVLVGSDASFPYSYTHTNATLGSRQLTVVAADGDGITFTSAVVNIVVEDFTPPPSAPTNNAPTPLRPASQVVALYNSSSTYANAPLDSDWYLNWGGGTGADFTIPETGATVLNYPNLSGFVGVRVVPGDYPPGSEVDAGIATHFHADVWSTANQLAEIKLMTETLGVPGSKYEVAVPIGITTGGDPGALTNLYTWNSVDVPLTAWTDLVPQMNWSNVIQMIWANNAVIDVGGVTGGDFFIDNVYFYNTIPAIQNVAKSGTDFTMDVFSEVGSSYQLQGTPTLTPPAWSNIGAAQPGNGGILNFSTPIGAGNQYFRVQQN